jgi:glycopeptide antibiotics resistance protein
MESIIDVIALFLAVLVWLGVVLFLRLKRGKDFIFLFFFTLFYIYILAVFNYTFFEFQSLLLLKYFMPNLILNGLDTGESINLFPLVTLTGEALKTSFLNILLFVPFGFGLPFIARVPFKSVVILGAFLSILIELLQFITGYMAQITFRIADINDVLFNTLGCVIGYVFFRVFIRLFSYAAIRKDFKDPFSRYINERDIL